MAFYSGTQVNAAGSLVGILDTELVKNTNWNIYDTPATNERVYECTTAGAEVFLHVADNQAGYATVIMWENWDAVNHVGVGLSTSTYPLYWRKSGTSGTPAVYWVVLYDEWFIYVNFGTSLNYGHFCGNIDRFCPEYNTPLLLGMRSTTATSVNPLGSLYWSAESVGLLVMDLENKQVVAAASQYATDAPGAIVGNEAVFYRESGSDKGFIEESIIVCPSRNFAIGIMRGVMAVGSNPNGVAHGDTFTYGGDTWEWVISGHASLIRKA